MYLKFTNELGKIERGHCEYIKTSTHKHFSFIKFICHTRKQTIFNALVTFIRKSFIKIKYMKSKLM